MDKYKLTSREQEVAQLLRKGLTNKEIAKELIISTATAKAHVKSIMEKLDARNRVLAAYILGKNDI